MPVLSFFLSLYFLRIDQTFPEPNDERTERKRLKKRKRRDRREVNGDEGRECEEGENVITRDHANLMPSSSCTDPQSDPTWLFLTIHYLHSSFFLILLLLLYFRFSARLRENHCPRSNPWLSRGAHPRNYPISKRKCLVIPMSVEIHSEQSPYNNTSSMREMIIWIYIMYFTSYDFPSR